MEAGRCRHEPSGIGIAFCDTPNDFRSVPTVFYQSLIDPDRFLLVETDKNPFYAAGKKTVVLLYYER